MIIYDAHSHLSFLSDVDISKYLKICGKTILGSYNFKDSAKQAGLQNRYSEQIEASIGLHPWHIDSMTTHDLRLETELIEKKIKDFSWLGELGIDRSSKYKDSIEKQKKFFSLLLNLSTQYNKKIILHAVKSEEDILYFLNKNNYKGLVHSFRGNYTQAKRFIDKGLYLSFGPNILKKKSGSFLEVLKKLPISSILVESDYPSQTKDRFILSKISEELARIRNTKIEFIVESTNNNFLNLIKG